MFILLYKIIFRKAHFRISKPLNVVFLFGYSGNFEIWKLQANYSQPRKCFYADPELNQLQQVLRVFSFVFRRCYKYIGLWNKTCNFNFNRSLRSQKLTVHFWKLPVGPKMNQKSLNYFLTFWSRDSSYGSRIGTIFDILLPILLISMCESVTSWRWDP